MCSASRRVPSEELSMNTPDLFDICARNHVGNAQSRAAHEVILPTKQNAYVRILTELTANPRGLTCEQLEESLGLKHQTASARVSELVRDGLIVVDGTRPTSSGCRARVLKVRAI